METYQLQSIGDPVAFVPCGDGSEYGENPIPEGEPQEPLSDDCACEQSLYWANLEGYNCEELNILYFYHPDYLGSVEFVTDMKGEPYQFFLNTPWGENLENQFAKNYTSFSSRFRFNGKEWDEETGNYYYGARYYDPKISVWLSVDPLSSARSWLTPYNFVQNNPILRIDPWGMVDTKYQDEEGKLIDETKDGNDQTVVIPEENKEAFLMELESLKEKGLSGSVMWNESLSRRFGVEPPMSLSGNSSNSSNVPRNFTASKNSLGTSGMLYGLGETILAPEGQWLGLNGKYYNRSWAGNGRTGSRNLALTLSRGYKAAGYFAFGVGTAISAYEGYVFAVNGNYAAVSKSSLDIGFGAFSFAGPVGMTVGGAYFIIDATIGWENSINSSERSTKFNQSILGSGWNQFRLRGGLK